jgi:hypothetical protein
VRAACSAAVLGLPTLLEEDSCSVRQFEPGVLRLSQATASSDVINVLYFVYSLVRLVIEQHCITIVKFFFENRHAEILMARLLYIVNHAGARSGLLYLTWPVRTETRHVTKMLMALPMILKSFYLGVNPLKWSDDFNLPCVVLGSRTGNASQRSDICYVGMRQAL